MRILANLHVSGTAERKKKAELKRPARGVLGEDA
jgi:hypothetical protein